MALVEVVPDVDPGPVEVDVAALEGGEFVDPQAEVGGDHERVVQRAVVDGVDVVEDGPEVVGGAEPLRGPGPVDGDGDAGGGVGVEVAVGDGPAQARLQHPQVGVHGAR